LTQGDLKVFGDSYVANTSSVDGKSAFLNEPAQHDHIEYFQSSEKFRENGLPTNLSAEKEAEVKRDLRFLALEGIITQLKEYGASPSESKTAKNKTHSYHSSLLKKALEQYQLE
jgi:LPS O-antigen subunit length determinant protein (WzzB/FepE family)